ncbi:MAG TPA: carboxypeptidase regulatory-like domain-containing protein [Gemmatimonadaceae bacterium]
MPTTARSLPAVLAAALVLGFVPVARAQDASHDLLRGTVRGPDNASVRNATVSVMPAGAAADARPFIVRSDTAGNWTMTLPVTAPSYAVTVTALGMKPTKVTAQRTGEGKPIVVNVTLARAVVELGAVRVVETRRRPPPREGQGLPADQSASERGADQVPGAVAAADAGNLAAMAASVPGVSLIPDAGSGMPGFSVLGLPPDQNSVTLNGMQFSGGDIPRDAIAFTRVTTTTYDVSRGGFSGGQLAIAAFAGGNFHQRTGHVTFDSPSLQFTDPVGERLASQYTNAQVSGSLTGPIVFNAVFYNVAVQAGRRSSDLQSLLSNDDFTFQRIGIARDSVQHFLFSVANSDIPFAGSTTPRNRERDNASLLARVDWNKSQNFVANVVTAVRRNESSALFLGSTALPGHGGKETASGADVTGTLSALVHKNILSDLRLGVRYNDTQSDPYLLLPDGRVLVSSRLADGTTGITALQFGGNPQLPRGTTTSGGEIFEQVSWLSENGKHRLRVTGNAREDAISQDQFANPRGSYFYNSLADFDANRPAVFSRTLAASDVSATALNYSMSVGDSWRPTDRTQFLYGVRAEGIRFGDTPAYNPAVESAFGLKTDHAPSEVHLSPRVGFSWGVGDRGTAGLRGAPLYLFRGGVGQFRNNTAVTVITPAMRATGLPGGIQQIQCVGTAVPAPDWNAFAANPSSIPSACVGGSSSFASTQPNVFAIAPDFAAQRSWRGSLSAQGPFATKWLVWQVEGVYSRNLNQPSPLDLNFNPVQQFSLAGESSRPVYAAPGSIVPATGALTNRDSRRVPQFGSVTELTSKLRSDSRQMILTLFPLQFLPGFTWNLTYVNQRIREQSRGFGSSTAGNPLDVEWGRSSLEAKHSVNASTTVRVRDLFSLALFARLSSGTPFTPIVSGDINGDGQANDRAFVFPSSGGDSAVASGMSALLAGAPSRIRTCLERQIGQIAQRNSCEGPWTATSNAVMTLNPEKLGMQNRVTLTLSLTNLPAGLDELLHGDSHMQGWGQPAFSDQTLLTVRGFDAATNRFRYDVNSRFGDTRVARSSVRAPFLMTLEARVQLGRVFTSQALDQAMSPGRTSGSLKLTPAQLKQRGIQSVFNPIGQLLAAKDSLTIITKPQLQQLTDLQRRISAQNDSIWDPLVDYLDKLPKDYDRAEALQRVYAAQLKMFDGIVAAMREAKQILTPGQVLELPPFMQFAFDEKALLVTRPRLDFFPIF